MNHFNLRKIKIELNLISHEKETFFICKFNYHLYIFLSKNRPWNLSLVVQIKSNIVWKYHIFSCMLHGFFFSFFFKWRLTWYTGVWDMTNAARCPYLHRMSDFKGSQGLSYITTVWDAKSPDFLGQITNYFFSIMQFVSLHLV